jgi:carboxyl-terminal processing protease
MTITPAAVGIALAVLGGAGPEPPPPAGSDGHGAPALAPAASAAVLDEIAEIVEQKFYSPARLQQVGWRAAVARARESLAVAPDAARRTSVIRGLLATLATSHTAFYPRDDPDYWALASIFEPVLQRACPAERTPGFPVARDDIGVFWKQVGTEWFAAGVFAGGPAENAGLRLGDRVLTANGRPFSPVRAFAGRAGKPVALEVLRTREGALIELVVTPRTTKPQEELRQASAGSWRILERRGRRIAYLHVWSWTSPEIHQAVLDAIGKSNAEAVDGFIIDLRDGWGGAAASYLGIFSRDVPVLEAISRDGKAQAFDNQIRKPAVLLVNGGTRSGKEMIAFAAKKHGLARLVGERTAGAVTFGQPFCLVDGSLLLLAVSDAKVDGERLEGRGVAPDLEVPFDPRYADGQDVQLQRALELLSSDGAEKR